jgi:hypothetical protein
MLSVKRFASLVVATVIATTIAYGMARASLGYVEVMAKKADRIATTSNEISESFELFDEQQAVTVISDPEMRMSTVMRTPVPLALAK